MFTCILCFKLSSVLPHIYCKSSSCHCKAGIIIPNSQWLMTCLIYDKPVSDTTKASDPQVWALANA